LHHFSQRFPALEPRAVFGALRHGQTGPSVDRCKVLGFRHFSPSQPRYGALAEAWEAWERSLVLGRPAEEIMARVTIELDLPPDLTSSLTCGVAGCTVRKQNAPRFSPGVTHLLLTAGY
jgi:hypothetical protein